MQQAEGGQRGQKWPDGGAREGVEKPGRRAQKETHFSGSGREFWNQISKHLLSMTYRRIFRPEKAACNRLLRGAKKYQKNPCKTSN